MKKKYVTPEMEITEFDVEDIITTSNTTTNDEWGLINGEDTQLPFVK